MSEAGWHHREGDPPGTVRRWNGVEWVGFAVPDPAVPIYADARPRLSTIGRVSAVVSVVGFVLLGLTIAFFVTAINRGAQDLPPRFLADVGILRLGHYVTGFGTYVQVITALALATTLPFITWWIQTGLATGVLERANLRRRRKEWLRRLRSISLGGWDSYRRADNFDTSPTTWRLPRRVPGLFGGVNRFSVRATRPGQNTISPIKIFCWWLLLWAPILVGVFVGVWLFLVGNEAEQSMQTVLGIYQVLLALEVVSLLCITTTVIQITSRLR